MIAWVSHHLPLEDGTLIGGAEMTDKRILDFAPEPVKIIHANDWKDAMDYDQIIITGTDFLSDEAMNTLAQKNPVVAVHHMQTRNEARANLISSSKKLICHTPRHVEIELEWTTPKSYGWAVAPLDSSEMWVSEKEDFALWASRMESHKGPENAIEWAKTNNIPLVMMYDKTRQEVLECMSRAKHFVFLPNHFDAEPRVITEAVLSGCNITTNELAGVTSIPNWRDPDVLRNLIDNAGNRFWEMALEK